VVSFDSFGHCPNILVVGMGPTALPSAPVTLSLIATPAAGATLAPAANAGASPLGCCSCHFCPGHAAPGLGKG